MRFVFWVLSSVLCFTQTAPGAEPLRALIIDGQNNHDWKATTPVLKRLLEETGRFRVDVATTPATGLPMESFRPRFSDYAVVVSNYNGDPWPEETKAAFERFVREGGGFVSFHAADNAFPKWPAYNEMIGLGGWGGRNERSGPYLRFRDGKMVRDEKPGPGGSHGQRHAFQVVMRDRNHPVAQGLPAEWMHHTDELYDRLRGPGENLTVVATAYSAPDTGGTGEHEPVLLAISYGRGRVFHTTLGHDVEAMSCVGFIATLQRGAEWAATGRVTQPPPKNLPTAAKVSRRPL